MNIKLIPFNISDRSSKTINSNKKSFEFTIEKIISQTEKRSVNLVKKDNEYYIMKIIKNYIYKSGKIHELKNILTNLQNPYVINYYSLYIENGSLYIITEYIKDGMNFTELIKENNKKNKFLSEEIIWEYLRQSLDGLLYLNKINNITNINIKPNNLLITKKGKLKIYNLDENDIKINENKDLGSYDIQILGKTFSYLMSNKLPEINEDKNMNIVLPEIYSEDLRKIISSFITFPTPIKKALPDVMTQFSYKYFKITSIFTILQCLLSIPPLICFFENGVEKYIKYDEDNKDEKYVITSFIKNFYNLIKQPNFDFENIKTECLKLRILMYNSSEGMTSIPEAEPKTFLTNLLTMMHNELNRYIDNSNKGGYNNINDINTDEDDKDNDNNIEVIMPQSTIFNKIKEFNGKYRSKISEIFYYLEKTIHECSKCNNIINYFCNIKYKCDLDPDNTSTYLNKNSVNITDLFRHYRKKRLYNAIEYCPNCGERIKQVFYTKIFYNSPLSIILVLNNSNKHIQIDEEINIQEFVEMKDISIVNYKLYGAVFSENYVYEDKYYINYISISKKENNEWIYFNGNSIKSGNFKNIINNIYQNNKKLEMLFYSRN